MRGLTRQTPRPTVPRGGVAPYRTMCPLTSHTPVAALELTPSPAQSDHAGFAADTGERDAAEVAPVRSARNRPCIRLKCACSVTLHGTVTHFAEAPQSQA